MEALARAEPQRWNLGGVPVFQAEVPGRVRALLMFRVGMVDEPLHMAGVTHLIEHLALSGLGEQPYEYNGSVDQTHTTFVVSGTADQVVDFLPPGR
jgi:zinc protease